MAIKLVILKDTGVIPYWTADLSHSLKKIFPFYEINIFEERNFPRKCWNNVRTQYDGSCLLSHFRSKKVQRTIKLILTSKDQYVEGLNFVFGVASRSGAVVSVFRLGNDPDFLKKEIIHELGHVFGLKHCTLPCVMTFSNSVPEAKMKNHTFCGNCSKKLEHAFKHYIG